MFELRINPHDIISNFDLNINRTYADSSIASAFGRGYL
jgi:hypothetical protein